MATVKELQAERVRRGFWIQRARKRKGVVSQFEGGPDFLRTAVRQMPDSPKHIVRWFHP